MAGVVCRAGLGWPGFVVVALVDRFGSGLGRLTLGAVRVWRDGGVDHGEPGEVGDEGDVEYAFFF